MKNKIENTAAQMRLNLLSYFGCIEGVQLVGDPHEESTAVLFEIYCPDGTRKKLFARNSKTANREVQTSALLEKYFQKKNYKIKTPAHRILEDNLFCREFIEGHTISSINGYYIACAEIQMLFDRSYGFPQQILRDLEKIITSNKLSYHDFAKKTIEAIVKWESYLLWRKAVCDFTSAPLPGEALRSVIHLLYGIHNSKIRMEVPFAWDRMNFLQDFVVFTAQLFKQTDLKRILATTRKNIKEIIETCRYFQLYDIHHDNILIGTSGTFYIIDLECSGLGSSDRILADPIWFIDDLASNFSSNKFYTNVLWARKKNYAKILRASPERRVQIPAGYVRVILCGTAAYQKIIQTLKETVFISILFCQYSTISIDDYDADIQNFELIWRDFQKLKRYVRGTSFLPHNLLPKAMEIDQLISYLFEGISPASDAQELAIQAAKMLARIKHFNIQPNSLEYFIVMRVFEYLRLLPFELILERPISKQHIEQSLERVIAGSVENDLDMILHDTLYAILSFYVPYHVKYVVGPFQFSPGLRRRCERKIKISEARKSNRTQYWLDLLLHKARTIKIQN